MPNSNYPPEQLAAYRAAAVVRFIASALNLEEAAAELASLRELPGLLVQDLRVVRNKARAVNERMLARFEAGDAKAVDTCNAYANLLNRLAVLGCHLPEAEFERAANAFAAVAQQYANNAPA